MDLHKSITDSGLGLGTQAIEDAVAFQKLLEQANTEQNLTRLNTPEDFIEGHLRDVVELQRSGMVDFPAMDLGSGTGVPGLLYGAVAGGEWVLVEAEKHKAEFLSRTVETLGLSSMFHVEHSRAEEVIRRSPKIKTVVARAVGPIERIIGWIGKCSTWNNLVLLKSRGWEEEWKKFSETPAGRKYRVAKKVEYEVGAEKKYRVIVRIERENSKKNKN